MNILPNEDHTLDLPIGEAVWFKLANASIKIKHEDDGIVIDVYRLGEELEEVVGATWVTHDELAPNDSE